MPTFSPAPQSAAPAPAEKPIDIMEFLATSENSAKPISSMAGSVEDAQRQPLLAPGAGKGLSIQYVVSGNPSTYPGMQLIKYVHRTGACSWERCTVFSIMGEG